MKSSRFIGALILALGLCVSGLAVADGRHHGGHSHIGIGFSFGFPYYYYPPPYYYPYPPVVVAPAAPPVYIEQGPSMAQQDYWYYCYRPEGYYPYVKECPGGWHQVEPRPADR